MGGVQTNAGRTGPASPGTAGVRVLLAQAATQGCVTMPHLRLNTALMGTVVGENAALRDDAHSVSPELPLKIAHGDGGPGLRAPDATPDGKTRVTRCRDRLCPVHTATPRGSGGQWGHVPQRSSVSGTRLMAAAARARCWRLQRSLGRASA